MLTRFVHPFGMPTPVSLPDMACAAVTICAVAVRRHGAALTQPAAPSPAQPPLPLQWLRLVFLSQCFRGCECVPRSREVCSVCGQNGFGRSGERAFASLGVQGCAGRPYGPPTAISSYCPCVYGRSCCPRMSNAGSSSRMLGGVNETRLWCEYRLYATFSVPMLLLPQ